MTARRILLADADAFFVAVARMVDPEGAGRAPLLIVGGTRESRGVVCSASYEARKYGVHSALPMVTARRRCPDLIVLPVDMQLYRRGSVKVMETLRELDYGVAAICGGMCSCATCHVYVDPEWKSKLPAPMSDERELLSELSHHQENSRLSCQIEFTPDLAGLRVTIAPDE